jgi:hypothetical protein
MIIVITLFLIIYRNADISLITLNITRHIHDYNYYIDITKIKDFSVLLCYILK